MAGLRDIVILDAADVARLGPYLDLVEAMARAHRSPAAVVRRIVFGPDGHDEKFMALPAWQPGEAIATKLVTIFPGNPGNPAGPDTGGLPAVQAVVLLFDGGTGEPLALVDGTELTYRKTAADSALGSRHCSRADARTLLMVGAGALAPHLIGAHRAVRPSIEQVRIWNRTAARADALVAAGIADERVDDLDAAVGEADIICTATMAKDPLIRGALVRPGTHLDCVGAYLPDHREVDDDVVRRATIFVDARPAPLTEGGDLVIPIASGVITTDDVRADLYQLCRGEHPGRTSQDQITMFENGGGGHLDLMVARHLWRARDA